MGLLRTCLNSFCLLDKKKKRERETKMQEASEQRTVTKEISVCIQRPENKRGGTRGEPELWGAGRVGDRTSSEREESDVQCAQVKRCRRQTGWDQRRAGRVPRG